MRRTAKQPSKTPKSALTDEDREWMRNEMRIQVQEGIRLHEETLATKIKGWIKEAFDAFRCSSSRSDPVVDTHRRSRTPPPPVPRPQSPRASPPQSPRASPPRSAFQEFGHGVSFDDTVDRATGPRHSMPEMSVAATMLSGLFGEGL